MSSVSQLPPGIPGPGETVADRFTIKRVLGAGGMGVVVEAYHELLRQPVALKFLRPEIATNEESSARFLREARSAAALKSEHVIRVYDADCNDQGIPFMVMEMLSGTDLETLLESRGKLSFEDGADFIVQACEGLAEAHARGIVHRDLKPANLFLTRRTDGTPLIKVLDFGIAKEAMGDAGISTQTGAAIGSPKYMSPEQLEDAKSVDSRTDIWALGVTMFEMFSGKTPFSGSSLPELCVQILSKEPASFKALCPDAPPAVVRTIARCLKKDPTQRYDTVAALVRELAPISRHGQTTAERIERIAGAEAATLPDFSSAVQAATGRASAGSTKAALSMPALQATPSPKSRRIAVGAAGALAVGVAAMLAWQAQGPDAQSTVGAEPSVETAGSERGAELDPDSGLESPPSVNVNAAPASGAIDEDDAAATAPPAVPAESPSPTSPPATSATVPPSPPSLSHAPTPPTAPVASAAPPTDSPPKPPPTPDPLEDQY